MPVDQPTEYCLFYINWWPICMGKVEWASWVQAVGSIAAILAAIEIARRQYLSARRQEFTRMTEERAAYAREVYLVLRESRRTLAYVAQRLGERLNASCAMRTERIESLQTTLQTLSSKALPANLLPFVVTTQREMSYTLMALRNVKDSGHVSQTRVDNAMARSLVVKKQAGGCKEWLDLYMMQIGQISDDSYTAIRLDEMIPD